MNEESYLIAVRKTLDELGSADSSADVTGSGDYWKHCRQVGIDAKVCAATIYSGVRHRHEIARTVIKENTSVASESPVREEWEVVVKRAGADADSITSTAGRRPDEVTSGNAIFAGFKDDEKAAAFSKKMTKAGYISSFGPRRDYTLHEATEVRAKDIDEHALEELDLYVENTAELYPQKQAILKNLEAKITRGVYDPDLAAKLWLYWVDAGAKMYAKEFADPQMWKVIYPKPLRMELARRIARREYEEIKLQSRASEDHREWSKVTLNSEADATALWRQLHVHHTVDQMKNNIWTTASYDVVLKALDKAGVKGHIHRETEEAPAATSEPPAAEECASCVPWQKVSRDASAAASNAELAQKYGTIKNAKDVYRVVGDAMNRETNEVFLVIPLDLRGELKASPYEVARGQLSRVTVDPGDVLRAALHAGAEAFLCAHNHPSGKATPSKADRDLTKSIKDAAAPYGKSLTYVDHVVIGQKRAYSIGEGKMYKIS